MTYDPRHKSAPDSLSHDLARKCDTDLPQGTLYQRKGRWWWAVKLSADGKREWIALKPPGSKYATKDRAVAVQIAWQKWLRATSDADRPPEPKTIKELMRLYRAYAADNKINASGERK